MPQVYCITGGIGSGKSTFSKLLKFKGFEVYNSDDRAKNLMNSNLIIKNNLIKLLGTESYNEKGKINKEFIAENVFKDKVLLESLNSIVHPEVKKDFEKWRSSQDAPVVFKESALLFESGSNIYCHKIILITADENIRIERVIERDKLTKEQILERINHQWTEVKKKQFSDFIIENNGTEEELEVKLDQFIYDILY